jgi:hypothetical protein
MLIEWVRETTPFPVERLLWIDPSGEEAITINIEDERARPVRRKCADLDAAIVASEARVLTVDPHSSLSCPEQKIKPKHRERRDKSWRLIAPLVESADNRIFNFGSHNSPITALAKRKGIRKATLYALLRRYWQRGQTKNALLPQFDQCGWRNRNEDSGKEGDRRQEGKKLGRPRRNSTKEKPTGMNITEDVLKRFRLGVKMFYETREKRTLSDAFQQTLETFFNCGYKPNRDGVRVPALPPAEELPSYEQFKYWYKKERNPRRSQIARDGEKKRNLTGRAVTGDSTQMAFGPGSMYQIDATIGDVYLVSSLDPEWIIGRPVIYMVVDVFSRMVAGLSVTLEGPSWVGAMLALENAAADKVAFCAEYGITIEESEWPCCHLSEGLVADRGELEGYDGDHLVNAFNMRLHNTPPHRGDLKAIVEQHFDLCNEKTIRWVPGAVRKRERGDRDYRLDAALNLHEFRKIMILSVLDHNNDRRIEGYRKDEHMIADHVEPYPVDLWNWGIRNRSGHLRKMDADVVRLNLLPEVEASITERGIRCGDLYYTCERALNEQWFVRAREAGAKKIRVARDPRNLDRIYLRLDGGKRVEICHLLEADKAFKGCDWYEALDEFELRRQRKESSRTRKHQSQAALHACIGEVVAPAIERAGRSRGRASNRARVIGIRDNRKAEREAERSANHWRLGDDPTGAADVDACLTDEQAKHPANVSSPNTVTGYVPPPQPIDKLRKLRERKLRK